MRWPWQKKKAEKQDAGRGRRVVRRIAGAGRSFSAAGNSELFGTFKGTTQSANADLVGGLSKLRARARQLSNDEPLARKFLHMVKANVVGSRGIQLQSRAKTDDGRPDRADMTAVERAWAAWGKRGVCDVSRSLSWVDVQRLFMETVARDGEALVVLHRGWAGSRWRFALQVLEADYLDESMNRDLGEGRKIVMGIEQDAYGAPVAYHLRTAHPGDTTYSYAGHHYERVPAADVIHGFLVERPGQSRGVPWMTTALKDIHHLGGYAEAAVVGARVAASRMGFYTTESGNEYQGDDVAADGSLIAEVEPGMLEQLPAGTSIQTLDWSQPHDNFGEFVKATVRRISAGWNVAYNGLANDLEGVNYSSIRAGVLEEREQWRVLQTWCSETLCDRVFQAWLDFALLTQQLPLPPRKREKFAEIAWQPRGWAWVDPLKDIQAAKDAIALGVGTRAAVAAATGTSVEDTFAQLAVEAELAREFGISVTGEPAAAGAPDMGGEGDDE
jgi:lambda family phage portal protein